VFSQVAAKEKEPNLDNSTAEIVEDLQAALAQFADIATDLKP
jgi:hypothetical protein